MTLKTTKEQDRTIAMIAARPEFECEIERKDAGMGYIIIEWIDDAGRQFQNFIRPTGTHDEREIWC